MKIIFRYIGFLIIILFLSFFLSEYVGSLYQKITGDYGSWIDTTIVAGFPLVYIFFLTLVFTSFGEPKKYWLIGILLIPVAIFEIRFDLEHIYIPVLTGILGWLIGYGINKLWSNLRRQRNP